MTRTLFTGGRVVDGTGADPAEADLVVEDGRIVEVGRGLDGDESVDLAGKAVLPGLFDCHTHVVVSSIDTMRLIQTPFSYRFFQAAVNLEATLRIGITTIRDAGGADLGVKQAVENGLVRGPRMHISLSMLSQTGGHGDGWMPFGGSVRALLTEHPGVPKTIVDGPDEMRLKVRELVRMGADVIKVATSGGVLSPRDKPTHAHFRLEELEVLVEEANAAGIFVMAHAQATPGIKNAIKAGIRSIDHGIYLDDEAIEMMLARGTWLVPTLVAPRGVIDAADAGAAIPEASVKKAREVADRPVRLLPAEARRGGDRHGERCGRPRRARAAPADGEAGAPRDRLAGRPDRRRTSARRPARSSGSTRRAGRPARRATSR